MNETQQSITEWGSKTFGEPKEVIPIVQRMLKEAKELEEAIEQDIEYCNIADECVDIYIVMCQVFSRMGYDLHQCVDIKMKINRARKWKLNGDGTGQHIKE